MGCIIESCKCDTSPVNDYTREHIMSLDEKVVRGTVSDLSIKFNYDL